MTDTLISVTGAISEAMYTYVLVFMLVGAGVYFTIRTKGVQFRYIKDMFTVLTEQKHVGGTKSVSSFQALMVSTASRVGTGNIAGIATAVATGGPGAVFWMWLMALIGSASAFVESTLAQMFKIKGPAGNFAADPLIISSRRSESAGSACCSVSCSSSALRTGSMRCSLST